MNVFTRAYFPWFVRGIGGKLRVGKTLYAVKLASEYSKRGGVVTANFDIDVPTFKKWRNPDEFAIDKHALIIIDEVLLLSTLGLLGKEWLTKLIAHAGKNRQHVLILYQGCRPPDLQPFKRLIGAFDLFTYIDNSFTWRGGRLFRVRDFENAPKRTSNGVDGNLDQSYFAFAPKELFAKYDSFCVWLDSTSLESTGAAKPQEKPSELSEANEAANPAPLSRPPWWKIKRI